MMSVSPNMELRYLTISQTAQLSQILDRNESWKSLMESIPKNLADLQQQQQQQQQQQSQQQMSSAKISRKYSSEQIEQIDETSKRLRRSPTEILLDEWGTSGRRRATVSDLLDLLVQVQLYRAADFVATDILKTQPPQRPNNGPAARIDISLPPVEFDEQAMEELLNNADYPNSSILNNGTNSAINNNNRDYSNNANIEHIKFQIPNRCSSFDELATDHSESDSHSDLIMFSANTTTSNNNNNAAFDMQPFETSESVLPSNQTSNTNKLMNLMSNLSTTASSQWNTDDNLPNLSAVQQISSEQYDHSNGSGNDNDNDNDSDSHSFIIPDISNLQIQEQSDSCSAVNTTTTNPDDTTSSQSVYIPNLSILNGNDA